MFRKKLNAVNLLKLYVSAPHEASLDILRLKNSLFGLLEGAAARFALNYGSDRNISCLPDLLNAEALDYLEIIDLEGRLLLSISRRMTIDARIIFQLLAVGKVDDSYVREQRLIRSCQDAFDVAYGYARILNENYNPATETKIRRGLLSSRVEMEAKSVWMFDSRELLNGAVKGIYPLNFWRAPALQRLKSIGFDLSIAEAKGDGIYCISTESGAKFCEANGTYAKFVRLDGMGT